MLIVFLNKCNSYKETLIKGFGILFTVFVIQSYFSVLKPCKLLTSLNSIGGVYTCFEVCYKDGSFMSTQNVFTADSNHLTNS